MTNIKYKLSMRLRTRLRTHRKLSQNVLIIIGNCSRERSTSVLT